MQVEVGFVSPPRCYYLQEDTATGHAKVKKKPGMTTAASVYREPGEAECHVSGLKRGNSP